MGGGFAAWPLLAVSVIAGAVLGVVEILHVVAVRGLGIDVAGIGGAVLMGVAAVALSIGFALLAVPALYVAVRLLGSAPGLAEWWSALRRAGAPRVTALAQGIVVAAAAGVFAIIAFAVAMWTQARFHAPGPIALLQAAIATSAAIAIVLVTAGLLRRVPAILAESPRLAAWTSGKAGLAVAIAAGVAVVAAGRALLGLAAPDADLRLPATVSAFVVLALGLFAADMGGRLGRRAAAAITGAGIALAAAGIVGLGSFDYARGAIAADGVASRVALGGVLRAGVAGGGAAVTADGRRVDPALVAHRTMPQPTAYPEVRGELNAILLTVDALRADHLSAYGYERPTTPTLEELAAEGTRFDWAITPSPTTRRAVPAIMTSRYPSAMTWQDMRWVRVEIGEHELISETFQRAGYETAAIHCCTTLFDKPHGMAEGFDVIDASADEVGREIKYNAHAVADNVVSYIEGRGGDDSPFFVWSHILDPHNPYLQVDGAPDFGRAPVDRYNSQIAFVDAQIGRIVEALEDAGLADRTLIALTSDHGQEFGEHGNRFHGRSLYNEVMRVPLIVYDPRAEPGVAPNVVTEPVSAIDVGPTLLDLAGIDRPAGKNGVSLAAAVRGGEPAPERVILGELIADYSIDRNLLAAYAYPWKLIWDQDANTYELFSLPDDPLDQRNLRHRERDVFREMMERLHEAALSELSTLP